MYLVDTNILVYLIRKPELFHNLNVLVSNSNVYISIVTVGEIRSLSKQNNWGDRKNELLEKVLNKFEIINIIDEITKIYAEIDAFSQCKLNFIKSSFTPRNMGKNDLWIASTASFFKTKLITLDNDFDHLKETFIVDIIRFNTNLD